MSLNVRRPRLFDHTDGDIIFIHATHLSSHLREVTHEMRSYGIRLISVVVAVMLWLASFLVEEFRPVGGLSGESVRLVVMTAAVMLTLWALHSTVKYALRKDPKDAQSFVTHLTAIKPLSHRQVRAFLSAYKRDPA